MKRFVRRPEINEKKKKTKADRKRRRDRLNVFCTHVYVYAFQIEHERLRRQSGRVSEEFVIVLVPFHRVQTVAARVELAGQRHRTPQVRPLGYDQFGQYETAFATCENIQTDIVNLKSNMNITNINY